MTTFSMSELDQSYAVNVEEQEDAQAKSIKDIEEYQKKEKERQQRQDDIALVVCMIILLLLTALTVLGKVMLFDPVKDLNATTFKPLEQEVKSIEKYTGNGYLPCNGYVPCQPVHLNSAGLADRIKEQDAMPCHDYNDEGEGPKGCW